MLQQLKSEILARLNTQLQEHRAFSRDHLQPPNSTWTSPHGFAVLPEIRQYARCSVPTLTPLDYPTTRTITPGVSERPCIQLAPPQPPVIFVSYPACLDRVRRVVARRHPLLKYASSHPSIFHHSGLAEAPRPTRRLIGIEEIDTVLGRPPIRFREIHEGGRIRHSARSGRAPIVDNEDGETSSNFESSESDADEGRTRFREQRPRSRGLRPTTHVNVSFELPKEMLVPGRNIAVADLKSRETLPPASAPHVGQRIRGQTQAADPRAETKVRRIARAETVQNEVDSTELEQTETSGPETSVYDSLDTVGDQGEQSETDIPQSMIRTNQSHGTKPSKVRDRKRPVPEGKEERPAPSEREASKHRQDDATLKKEWANSKPASISTRLQKSDDDTSLSSNSPPRRSSLQADTRPSASIVEKPRQTESKNTPAEAGGDNEGATGASTTGTSPRVSLSLPDAGLQNATPSQPPQTSIVSASGANIDDVPIRTGASLPNEAAEKPQPTRPCRCCGRRFALDRIEKHEGVCTRANSAADGQTQTKKKYDPAAARRHGTELEGFQSGRKSATELKRIQDAERAKHAWKEKHEELIQSLRAAKHLQQHLARGGKATDIPVPPPSRPNGVQCPSCLRMFNENSIEKHQEICERLKAKGRPIKVNPRFSAATSIGKSRGRGGIDSPL